jgi:hypothetical protein
MNTYGTEISSTLVGRREEDDWPHFKWTVVLTRDGATYDLPYKMGLGHQQTKCGQPMPSLGRYNAVIPCQHSRCHNAGWQPTPPTLYDVLTALKADAPRGEAFEEWAPNLGYDTDSRRALDIYVACQKSEMLSRRFFGSDWERILDDEDYQ